MSKNMQSPWSKNISMSNGELHCSGISASALAAEFKTPTSVSYTHLRAHETGRNLVCRLLLEKKK